MATAALVKFRTQIFQDAVALNAFVTKDNSPVNTIVAILSGGSGEIILFYMVA